GLTSKDVEISVDDDHLIITGEKKFEDEVKEDNFYRMERRYGTFERHVPLPAAVEKNKIDATYKKGVLEVHLPKEEVRKPAKVKVEVKEA
ncbi:MAG: Hsp20/alpha crystallin family protein, partial [Terriglobia bacterium]